MSTSFSTNLAIPLSIGPVRLATNLLLAPIAGYCDVSYRLIVRSCGGVGMACTDLLCPEGVLRQTKRSMELAATCEADSPLCMQLYGANVDRLCEAARWAEDRGAHVIDINMGCPVDKVTKRDGGSKLLCDPDNTLRMVERIIAVLRRVPLTCKLRLGWDDSCIVAPYMARRLEAIGVQMVTVHGRTTEMKFKGQARWDAIGEVVAAVGRIPIIGNGDVKTPYDAERLMRMTGCSGIMIGRAALSVPWIFRDIWRYLTTGEVPPPPSFDEKVALMRRHFYNTLEWRSEQIAAIEMRKRVSWWAKTMTPAKPLKEGMLYITTAADFERVVDEYVAWRQDERAPHRGGAECELTCAGAMRSEDE